MRKVNIFEIVEYMAALIRAEERKRCAELRLQLVHFEVLDYLAQANQYTDTPAATASYFGMTRGTVSQSLIVLEKKGYIEKNKDVVDKRIIHVNLLPQGNAILKKARRTELFNKATTILNVSSANAHKYIFLDVLSALQKAAHSQSFKAGKINKFNTMKKPTAFDLIECMATLIRSEERKKCTELKLQMVHFQILNYLSVCNKYSNSPAAIANFLGMTRGTVSQSLMILEKRGFIQKVQDSSDKRVYHIHLLTSGLETLKNAKPTDLFKKAALILEENNSIKGGEALFVEALTALQKANDSHSFGVCKTCKNFTRKSTDFFCELTQETLSKKDSDQICQEHIPV